MKWILVFIALVSVVNCKTKPRYPYCRRAGNLYQAITVDHVPCGGFRQTDKINNGITYAMSCSSGTLFDVKTCVCNHKGLVKCKPIPPPPYCKRFGNLYEPIYIDGKGCAGFSQVDTLTGGIKYSLACPDDTLFDVKYCVCTQPWRTKCPI